MCLVGGQICGDCGWRATNRRVRRLAGGRCAILVGDVQRHLMGQLDIKEHIDLVPEAKILRALPNVEHELGLPETRVPGVELQDAVFAGQAAQG